MSVDWERVYGETYDDLVRYLYRKVWDVERARDLAQDVFIRALRHDPDDPRAWLFTVATNLARDEARTQIRRKRHLQLVRDAEGGRTQPTPESEMEAREARRRVRSALESLRERDREILLLWDAGLSYAHIAGRMGLAPGAVGTTLARARRRLLEAYEEGRGSHAAHR